MRAPRRYQAMPRLGMSSPEMAPQMAPRCLPERAPTWLWALALGLLLFLLLGLGRAPLFDVDEGAFSEAAREMLSSGDWGHTTLNGAACWRRGLKAQWLKCPLTFFELDLDLSRISESGSSHLVGHSSQRCTARLSRRWLTNTRVCNVCGSVNCTDWASSCKGWLKSSASSGPCRKLG